MSPLAAPFRLPCVTFGGLESKGPVLASPLSPAFPLPSLLLLCCYRNIHQLGSAREKEQRVTLII